jgi:hypothetical protein
VRDIGVTHRDVRPGVLRRLTLVAALATALVYGVGGNLASTATSTSGTLVALAACWPALRTAHRAVQRAGRRHDRWCQLRAGLRGARPRADGRREARRRRAPAGRPDVRRVRRRPVPLPGAEEVSLASLESVRVLESRAVRDRCCTGSRSGPSRADGRARRAVGRRQDDDHPARDPAVRRERRGGPVGGVDVRDATLESPARRRRRGHAGRPHVPRHDPRPTCSTPGPAPPRSRSGRAARRPGRTSSRRCPTGSTPSSATAATGSPAVRSSGWRSPGCCSRRRTSSCSTRRPRTSTASPRPPCSGR